MKIILNRDEIKNKIDFYCQKLDKNFINKTTIFIGILEGTLPFALDLLRTSKSMLTEIDFIFRKGKNKFTKLKRSDYSDKNIVLLVDRLNDNTKIKEYISYLEKNFKPENLSIYAILKDKNYQNKFNNNLDYILEVDENNMYCGYGMKSDAEVTDYLNIYQL